MKKLVFITFLMILFVVSANAQVTIGENAAPDGQAVLDLRAGNSTDGFKGLLMPRVTLTAANLETPFVNPLLPGMTVYHVGNAALPAGIYTWDGVKWISGSGLADGIINVLQQNYTQVTEGDTRIVYDRTTKKLYQEVYGDDGTGTGNKTWIRTEIGGDSWFYMPSMVFETEVDATKDIVADLYAYYKKQFETPARVSTGAPASILPVLPAATDFYYYVIGYDDKAFSIAADGITAEGKLTYRVIDQVTDASYINIIFVKK